MIYRVTLYNCVFVYASAYCMLKIYVQFVHVNNVRQMWFLVDFVA